ncbi:MAG: hypothetical protein NUV61_01650 [Candidatus Azambacteria bacterium]|nr:hypothetical protein [Candidatus Azambacteria bacterium]
MTKNISQKVAQTGNYTVKTLSTTDLARMTQQDIVNAAAIVIKKGQPGVQVISVANKSILEQALCTLPEINVKDTETIIRYINTLPDGQALISYFGEKPNDKTIASLLMVAKAAKDMNGAIMSGYSAIITALGEEKHYLSGGTVIQKGMENIRIAGKEKVVFSYGIAIKEMMLNDFVSGNWSTATTVTTLEKKVLFIDRVQNGITNIVTDNVVLQGFNLLTKRATITQDQDAKHKVLSFVQWYKNAAILATPLGLTKEPALALAV